SMPQLVDANFCKSVVLLCKHTDDGAFGLIVNRPLVTTGRVVVTVDPLVSTERELQVWLGGPVETERSCMLVGSDEDSYSGMRISEGLYLSTSPDLLRRLLEPNPPPTARLMVGYSGWRPGQLETELQDSDWVIVDVDRELIFDVEPDLMWEKAMRRIGADPTALRAWRVH